jgi:hypothetical protein
MAANSILLTEALIANGTDADDPAYAGVKIQVAPSLLRKVWASGTAAMSMPRHIYVTPEAFRKLTAGEARRLVRHESVHIEQWRRHGRIGFLTKYLSDYVRGRRAGLSHKEAYRAIPFEKEAVSRSV